MSFVWTHFEKLPLPSDSAKCLICGNIYKRGGGTSNLKDHLRRKHREVTRGEILPHNGDNQNLYSNDNPVKNRLDKYLLKLFATDYQHFRIVEDAGLKEFIRQFDPKYKMPCRQTLSEAMLPDLFNKVKTAVFEEVSKVKRVALTTEAWTGNRQDAYVAVTAHYICNDMLKAACLDCSVLPINHTAQNIAARLTAMMDEWRITTKVTAIVTDNASVMKAAVRLLNIRHLPCAAQTLNLVVNDAVETSVGVKIILDKCAAIVTYFRQNSIASEKLHSKRRDRGEKSLNLIQSVSTRWNSRVSMMRRLLELKEDLLVCHSELPNAPPMLDGGEWLTLQNCITILTPLEDISKQLSTEKYVPASLVIPLVHGLTRELNYLDTTTMTDPAIVFLASIHKSTSESLLQYEDRSVTKGATLLHPGFKKAAFLSKTKADDAKNQVELELRALLQRVLPDNEATASTPLSTNVTFPPHPKNNLLGFLKEIAEEQRRTTTCSANATMLVRQYLELPLSPELGGADPIKYWYNGEHSQLSTVAGYYLCIPATSVPAERIFSKAGCLLTERRNSLSPKKAKMLIFLHGTTDFY